MNLTIVRAVETCMACPSQWNAWTAEGQYLYLRYRGGIGTVHAFESEDISTWHGYPGGAVAVFEHGDELDGCISLEDFCRLAGIIIADDAHIVTHEDYFDEQIREAGLDG